MDDLATSSLGTFDGRVDAIAVSRDGSYIVAAINDDFIRVLSTKTKETIFLLDSKTKGAIIGISINDNDNEIFTLGSDGQFEVWGATSGRILARLHFPSTMATSLAFQEDTFVIGTHGHGIEAWDAPNRAMISHPDSDPIVSAVDRDSNGSILVDGADALSLITPSGERQMLVSRSNTAFPLGWRSACFLGAGRVAVAEGNRVCVMDQIGGVVATLFHPQQARHVAVSPDGQTVAVSGYADLSTVSSIETFEEDGQTMRHVHYPTLEEIQKPGVEEDLTVLFSTVDWIMIGSCPGGRACFGPKQVYTVWGEAVFETRLQPDTHTFKTPFIKKSAESLPEDDDDEVDTEHIHEIAQRSGMGIAVVEEEGVSMPPLHSLSPTPVSHSPAQSKVESTQFSAAPEATQVTNDGSNGKAGPTLALSLAPAHSRTNSQPPARPAPLRPEQDLGLALSLDIQPSPTPELRNAQSVPESPPPAAPAPVPEALEKKRSPKQPSTKPSPSPSPRVVDTSGPYHSTDLAIDGKQLTITRAGVVHKITAHSQPLTAVALSNDGTRVVTGSKGKTVRLFDCESGKKLLILKGHKTSIGAVGISTNNKFIASASSDKVKVWDLAKTAGDEGIYKIKGFPNVVAISVDSMGFMIAIGRTDNRVDIIGPTGKNIATFNLPDAARAIAFSQDGRYLVSATISGIIQVWNSSIDGSSVNEEPVYSTEADVDLILRVYDNGDVVADYGLVFNINDM
ncbi:WD domain G-beta repeat [Carpediemonas membranifera]|uniref:WD domain G-beta repeat n=1 Tax=Carpediemonas membranifera TaxID=201153 RepID=A0A8J6APT5_9EUKA|nr:WD domain G-beta repeat [Carpediemonas membranifera]|eukprot:KAG9389938.1 WD domain G-beta repeat [Carpediemonas membranifera]